MTEIRDIILKLKDVRKERNLSYGKIIKLMEPNGDYLSKSTLSRLFSDGSEDEPDKFSYQRTIRPVAKALLDIETIEDDDDLDVQAMKSLLRYKIQRIEELEDQVKDLNSRLQSEKDKHRAKMDKEREQFQRSLDFLKNQILLKDNRIDQLMSDNTKYAHHIVNCPYREVKK